LRAAIIKAVSIAHDWRTHCPNDIKTDVGLGLIAAGFESPPELA